MPVELILLIHILVVGYWLGSELVINSSFRYVCWSSTMPFEERARLMDHVMLVDQHVRYALVLQAALGTALAAWLGYVPGGNALAGSAIGAGALWLAFVELTHRRNHHPSGATLSLIDRTSRAALALGLIVIFAIVLTGAISLPLWLAAKLFLFAGVIICGLVIRLFLMQFFKIWADIGEHGTDDSKENRIREIYVKATATLFVLWFLISLIVWLSFTKAVPLL